MKCNATAEPLMQEISIEQIFNLDLPLTNEKDGAVFAHKFKRDLVAMTTSLIVAKYFDKEHKNVIRAIKDGSISSRPIIKMNKTNASQCTE